jgi:hypothetical protein
MMSKAPLLGTYALRACSRALLAGSKPAFPFRFRGCHWRTAAPLAALVLAPEAYGFTDAGTVTAHADIPACC